MKFICCSKDFYEYTHPTTNEKVCTDGCKFHQTPTKCKACMNGFYLSQNKCLPCSNGCLKCDKLEVCSKCGDGFWKSRVGSAVNCKPCDKNCLSCFAEKGDKCVDCKRGYFLDQIGKKCQPCKNNSVECTGPGPH